MDRSAVIHGSFVRSQRFDADESAILARELESIEAVLTQTRYPELKALLFVPVIGGIDAGADTYTWRRMNKAGEAKLLANMAEDLPSVDIDVSENYTAVRSIGDKYGYSVHDLRSFALARKRGSSIQLDVERARTAKLIIDRKVDEIISIGASDVPSIIGMTNDSSVNIITPVAGSWGTPTAPLVTAQQMLQDMFAMERTVFTQSLETAMSDTMLMPLNNYALASTTPLGVNNDKTVLDFFLKNALSTKEVHPWYRLATAGAGSVARMISYKRDPLVLGAVLPVPFEAQAPQPHNLSFTVPCEARCGGTVIKYPLGVVYMDGV